MRCPACGNTEAFAGFTSIDCPNSACKFFQGTAEEATLPDPSWAAPVSPRSTTNVPITQGATGATGIATVKLTVSFNTTLRTNNVIIEFTADGDPGVPNKKVEFLWKMAGMNSARVCTLSSRNTYFLTGVDANGVSIYRTIWLCNHDGIQPGDPWTLEAIIS